MELTKEQDIVTYLFLFSGVSIIFNMLILVVMYYNQHIKRLKNTISAIFFLFILLLAYNSFLLSIIFSEDDLFFLGIHFVCLFLSPFIAFLAVLKILSKKRKKYEISLNWSVVILLSLFFILVGYFLDNIKIFNYKLNLGEYIYYFIIILLILYSFLARQIIVSFKKNGFEHIDSKICLAISTFIYLLVFLVIPVLYFLMPQYFYFLTCLNFGISIFLPSTLSVFVFITIYKMQEKGEVFTNIENNDSSPAENLLNIKSFDAYIKTHKPYLNPKHTIVELAKEIGTNRSYLSRFINENYNMNFVSFINKCRYEELQELKKSPQFKNLEDKDLIYLVGFISYHSFKKVKNKFQEY